MSTTQSRAHILLGSLTGDAATLGVHWLYDPERIAEIAARRQGQCAFTPVDRANYEDTMGYFAHAARRTGMFTQYGECLYLAIESMNANQGVFDPSAHQAAFLAHFGPGGSYQGYIDRPTSGALEKIAAQKTPSGIDDDQLPAIARLPAIMAAQSGDDLLTQARTAMEITNVNEVALDYTGVFVELFTHLLSNAPLDQALDASAKSAPDALGAILGDALATPEDNATTYAAKTGRACHLPMAGPLIFHILKRSQSFEEAIERNAQAGGDNAGRSILIGAVMGLVHGLDGPKGIPLKWVLQLEHGAEIWANCQKLAHSHD